MILYSISSVTKQNKNSMWDTVNSLEICFHKRLVGMSDFVTKQDAKGERITTDLAFAGSSSVFLQVVTEQSPPSSTLEPMENCLNIPSPSAEWRRRRWKIDSASIVE